MTEVMETWTNRKTNKKWTKRLSDYSRAECLTTSFGNHSQCDLFSLWAFQAERLSTSRIEHGGWLRSFWEARGWQFSFWSFFEGKERNANTYLSTSISERSTRSFPFVTPALLIKIVGCPIFPFSSFAAISTSAFELTSQRVQLRLFGRGWLGGTTSQSTTFEPLLANCFPISKPRPPQPPVIRAISDSQSDAVISGKGERRYPVPFLHRELSQELKWKNRDRRDSRDKTSTKVL